MIGLFLDKSAELKTDSFVYFHPNGNIERTGRYEKNLRAGKWVYYFEDSKLDAEGSFIDDKKTGLWTYYHTNGQKSSDEESAEDELQKIQAWLPDGTATKDTCTEQRPMVVGGEEALMHFLSKNINYPPDAQENNITGKVIISFIVDSNGNHSGYEVLRSPWQSLERETLRIVKLMPQFTPYCSHNRKLSLRYTLPVVFRLR
ncbi:MAG: TonB family protein [Bacteroidota bacterium]